MTSSFHHPIIWRSYALSLLFYPMDMRCGSALIIYVRLKKDVPEMAFMWSVSDVYGSRQWLISWDWGWRRLPGLPGSEFLLSWGI